MFNINKLLAKAKARNKTINFPEAGFSDRTIQAVKILKRKKICNVILVGDESSLVIRDKSLLSFTILNPKTYAYKNKLAKHLYLKRKDKGMTIQQAETLVQDPYYFATLLVDLGVADGMVAGAECSTASTIASSCFLMYGKNKFMGQRAMLFADCGLNENPTAAQLVDIAGQTVESGKLFGFDEMNVAFLSYSTHGSAKSEMVDKVRQAASKFSRPAVVSDGEMQLDAALRPEVAALKAPNSPIQGNANIFIFPDLNSGNICYKAIQMFGGMNAIGPIVQGLKKPVNDLSRGCNVNDIVILSAITALQAKEIK